MTLLTIFAAPNAPGFDWLAQFTNNLTELTTANGDALTAFGTTLLSFISFIMLVQMVVQYSAANMTFTLNPTPLHGGKIVHFMLRLLTCTLMEHYWTNPLPGSPWGLNKLFAYFAQQIVQALDQNRAAQFAQLLANASTSLGAPSLLSISEQICYWCVQLGMAFTSAVLFVINISSFIFYAVTALFGPIFIPLLMTHSFRGKFFSFVETLLSFAMIRAVAAAFIFVWGGFMSTFIQQTFNGDYSIAMWLANFVPVLMVLIAFNLNMLFIPAITQAIFGGGAAATASAQQLATRLLVRKG